LKNLTESSNSFTDKMNRNDVMKLIELQFRGKTGCAPLLTKVPGQDLQVQMQNQLVQKNATIGGMKVLTFRYQKFIPINEDGSSGVAEVLISLQPKGESSFTSSFPVPVKVNPVPKAITGCDMGQTAEFQELVDELCAKTYGTVSAGMSCIEVVATLKRLATLSICNDLYGNPSRTFIQNGHCNLTKVHLGKRCSGTKAIRGFDDTGDVICVDTQ
jgi:hypothetical protein